MSCVVEEAPDTQTRSARNNAIWQFLARIGTPPRRDLGQIATDCVLQTLGRIGVSFRKTLNRRRGLTGHFASLNAPPSAQLRHQRHGDFLCGLRRMMNLAKWNTNGIVSRQSRTRIAAFVRLCRVAQLRPNRIDATTIEENNCIRPFESFHHRCVATKRTSAAGPRRLVENITQKYKFNDSEDRSLEVLPPGYWRR